MMKPRPYPTPDHNALSRATWLSVATFIFMAGCSTLPNTQPFADATAGLGGAVASSGSVMVAEIKSTPFPQAAAQGAKLEEAWAARNRAMSALMEYADSVQAITSAGKQGEESAKKLATAVDGLAQSLGAASLGASAAGSLAVDTFSYAYGQIAKARAAHSLEESLAVVQPAIERIAVLFAADLKAADETVTLAIRAQRDALADANQSELAYRRQLIATQNQIMGSIRGELADNKMPTELSRVDELNRITAMLAQNDTWFAGYQRDQNAISDRGRAAHELIAATASGFTSWAAAHAGLLAAVRTKHPPSATELLAAAGRINDLVERYRKL